MMQGPSVDSSGCRFTPLVVVELASDTKEEAIAWLLSRIRDPQQNGGMAVIYSLVIVFHSWSIFHCTSVLLSCHMCSPRC